MFCQMTNHGKEHVHRRLLTAPRSHAEKIIEQFNGRKHVRVYEEGIAWSAIIMCKQVTTRCSMKQSSFDSEVARRASSIPAHRTCSRVTSRARPPTSSRADGVVDLGLASMAKQTIVDQAVHTLQRASGRACVCPQPASRAGVSSFSSTHRICASIMHSKALKATIVQLLPAGVQCDAGSPTLCARHGTRLERSQSIPA
jgi:hypothetical protein